METCNYITIGSKAIQLLKLPVFTLCKLPVTSIYRLASVNTHLQVQVLIASPRLRLVSFELMKRGLMKRRNAWGNVIRTPYNSGYVVIKIGQFAPRGKRDIADTFDTECQLNSIKADDSGSHTRCAYPSFSRTTSC